MSPLQRRNKIWQSLGVGSTIPPISGHQCSAHPDGPDVYIWFCADILYSTNLSMSVSSRDLFPQLKFTLSFSVRELAYHSDHGKASCGYYSNSTTDGSHQHALVVLKFGKRIEPQRRCLRTCAELGDL